MVEWHYQARITEHYFFKFRAHEVGAVGLLSKAYILKKNKYDQKGLFWKFTTLGGAEAEWSKALLVRENKRKDPRFAPRPGHL